MTHTKQTLHVPMCRLARSCERALDAWRAHGHKHASLGVRGAALAPAAERFLASSARHDRLQQHAAHARRERTDAARALRDTRLQWLPSLRHDLPGLDTSGLNDSHVPEDEIASSRTLRHRVEGRLRGSEELAYADALHSALVAAEQRAQRACREAGAALTQAQEASDERRAAAMELDDQLILFRATLSQQLGTNHADYRKLRVRPARKLERLDPARELERLDPARELERLDPARELERLDPARELERLDAARELERVDAARELEVADRHLVVAQAEPRVHTEVEIELATPAPDVQVPPAAAISFPAGISLQGKLEIRPERGWRSRRLRRAEGERSGAMPSGAFAPSLRAPELAEAERPPQRIDPARRVSARQGSGVPS